MLAGALTTLSPQRPLPYEVRQFHFTAWAWSTVSPYHATGLLASSGEEGLHAPWTLGLWSSTAGGVLGSPGRRGWGCLRFLKETGPESILPAGRGGRMTSPDAFALGASAWDWHHACTFQV